MTETDATFDWIVARAYELKAEQTLDEDERNEYLVRAAEVRARNDD